MGFEDDSNYRFPDLFNQLTRLLLTSESIITDILLYKATYLTVWSNVSFYLWTD